MRVSPKLLFFEVLTFLVFAVLFGAGFLAWRLQQGPIDLEFIRPQIEKSLSDARKGQPVKFQGVALEWVRDRNKVEAVVRDLTALDAKGEIVFRAKRASIAISAASLLSGTLKTTGIRLEDGAATVIRSKDGVWSLADMVIAKEPPDTGKPFDPFKDLNWTTLATPIRALISAGQFEKVELANFNLTVNDQKSKTVWSANPVAGVWSAGKDGVAPDLSVKLVGTSADEPNAISISLASDGAVTKATGRLTLERVNPLSVAKVFGYTGDAFAPATPGNAAFTIEATEKGGLQSTRLGLSDISGVAKIGDRQIAVSQLALEAIYDPDSKQVSLESLNLASDIATGEFSGSANLASLMLGDASKPVAFRLAGKDLSLNLAPTFETAWPFNTASVEGSVAPDLSRLTVASFKGVTGELTASGSGEVWMEGPPEARVMGVKALAKGDGVATPEQIAAFWPQHLGSAARAWVREHLLDGKASNIVFRIDMPPGVMAGGFLPDDNLQLDFTLRDANLKFLADFPAVTGVTGKGRLRGNSISIDATGGQISTWGVEEGHFVVPQFVSLAPKAAPKPMDISVIGRGDLGQLMRVLDASNLKVGERYNLQVDQMAGSGGVELHMQLPTHETITEKNMRYAVTGRFRDASAPDLAAGFGLADSDVTFDLSQDAIAINGGGQFGPTQVVFAWNERFAEGLKGSEFTARAKATPDLLNAFGIAARNYMQGEAAVSLRAVGPGGRDFSSVTADVDFGASQIEIAELGWRKKYDAPAKGTFTYNKNGDGAGMVGELHGEGLELVGEARMDGVGQFTSANIRHIYSRDSIDLAGRITQRSDGGYRIAFNGPYFDASRVLGSFLSMSDGGDNTDMHGEPVGGPAEQGPILEINLDVDKLKLRENAEMTAAKIALVVDGEGPRSGTMTGVIGPGKKVDVALSTIDDKLKTVIKSDDAGFVMRAIATGDFLQGGKLNIEGTYGDGVGDYMVTLNDVRITSAAAQATQVFATLSLQGLADILNDKGILFTEVKSPIKLQDKRVDIVGLQASGPAMGFTAKGWFVPATSALSLRGVVVPSYGINSFLGGLPVIGDLFVSRQGEGVLAPIYSVRGSLYKMQVTMDPISALAPGVLRRMFEHPDEPPPGSDDVAPPSAPMAQNSRTKAQ